MFYKGYKGLGFKVGVRGFGVYGLKRFRGAGFRGLGFRGLGLGRGQGPAYVEQRVFAHGAIYTGISIYIYIYIYIERERERTICIYIYRYVCIYVYIYIFILWKERFLRLGFSAGLHCFMSTGFRERPLPRPLTAT